MKITHLENILGFTLLAVETIGGIPLILYHTASQAYINAKQQAPKVNQFVSDIRSQLPDFSDFQYLPTNFYNNQEQEDTDIDSNKDS